MIIWGGVKDFIMKIIHIQDKLKAHDTILANTCIVHHALNVLPSQPCQIKTTIMHLMSLGPLMISHPNV